MLFPVRVGTISESSETFPLKSPSITFWNSTNSRKLRQQTNSAVASTILLPTSKHRCRPIPRIGSEHLCVNKLFTQQTRHLPHDTFP